MERLIGTVTAGARMFVDIEIWIEVMSGSGFLPVWQGVFRADAYINLDTSCRLVLDDGRSGAFMITKVSRGPSYTTEFLGTGLLE
jgi:hypothetical protein